MILNLYFIKNTNGLFYYSLDYYESLKSDIEYVIVNDAIFYAASKYFGQGLIKKMTLLQFLGFCIHAFKENIFIFTPSSHPIPFVRNQLVVVHDPYPFYGGIIQNIKRFLLKISLITSRCNVGHINTSNSLPFIEKLNVPNCKRVFMPNKFPDPPQTRLIGSRKIDDNIRIGLVGTDSAKKRYELLFKEILLKDLENSIDIKLYGHHNSYVSNLCSKFDSINVEVINSDSISLQAFLTEIDILVSVAIDEGFSRPIAAALQSGIPCHLLESPVFSEFYSGYAYLYHDIQALIEGIIIYYSSEFSISEAYNAPQNIVLAIEAAPENIRNLIRF